MTKNAKPCTIGPKHKWSWQRNVAVMKATYGPRGNSVQMSLRGLYKCQCGAHRVGKANHDDFVLLIERSPAPVHDKESL